MNEFGGYLPPPPLPPPARHLIFPPFPSLFFLPSFRAFSFCPTAVVVCASEHDTHTPKCPVKAAAVRSVRPMLSERLVVYISQLAATH